MNEHSPPSARLIRFGAFELDPKAGELRKSGMKTRLPEQSLQLLMLLLEQPGEVVTREEMRKRLWPNGTFVDFDHSLNAAMKRLREALDDSADNARFVETLPRHGYRFIAPVAGAEGVRLDVGVDGVRPLEERATTKGTRRVPLQKRWIVAATGTLVVILAVLLALNVAGLRDRLWVSVGARRAVPLQKIESIAVLPLENLSGDPQQEYFADGMTEELITDLGKISALRVISRTSVMRYKGTKKSIPEIARELNVNAVMEGSVMRSGDRVRVTAQLIQAIPEKHLWSESYERDLRDVLALQSEVAQAIAREVQVKLTPQEQTRLARARPVNPAAYNLYVLGRHYWNQRTMHGLKQAIATFGKALEQDPSYAPAYAALADSYMLLGEQGGLTQREARSLAEAAIRKALELDESVADAHSALGQWKAYYEWNWAQAEQAYKRAIELNPSDAGAHARYGRFLSLIGRFEDANFELQRARELDPLSVSMPINAYYGQAYLFARQYDRAAELLQQALEISPNHPIILHNLGELYLARGRFTEAIAPLERSVQLSGQVSGAPSSHFLAMLGCAYARANRKKDALKILNELQRRSRQDLVSAFDMASLHTALGEKERAIACLEQGFEQRDTWFIGLKAWPWFDSLRSDPRFQALLRRMNFPP